MLENSSKPGLSKRASIIAALTAWLVAATIVSIAIASGLYWAIDTFNLLGSLPSNVETVLYGVIVYSLLLAVLLLGPWLWKRHLVTRKVLGLHRLVSWLDIGVSLSGIVLYFIAAIAVTYAVMQFVPSVDLEQTQDVGITLPTGYELVLAFLLLVIIGPIIEEVIFRGYLYGTLRRYGVSIVTATLVVSVLFGIAHGQWNVGINVAVLSVVMCLSREITGSLWPSILMHMMKNGIAYVALYGASGIPGLQ